ncbi:dTDP-4-dehydrorhamnose 3,5-epimerase [Gloeobacter violaceus]|uniref:dTDP-4-dehydrorhamnose 3,5-epimerase n=1 Tax=Gloeobacter violaceus (strain ATCC 29082 / PCC 7421) TaxID=251221 RepID=Q7NNE1_GLOVI|nr:dTDP-4-dehydrorhamnose 3,5-epimerase [Gloeobacter violaceus]BAC88411.1 dTDP-4-dehydrorhamnose 3,5-epimerase [Gloeobacter violaceus PCC 7421]
MRFIATALPGVVVIEPAVYEQSCGYFFESYQRQKFAAAGISVSFVQEYRSRSAQGTLRGLHYQLHRPQARLYTALHGELFAVAIDVRKGSPSFGQSAGVLLSAANKQQLFVPRGFAHGLLVLSQKAEFMYKCDEFFYPQDERGVLWSDPALGIAWRIEEPVLSARDRCNLPLSRIDPLDLPTYP